MRFDLAVIFLLNRFFYRIANFFVHWYGHTFQIISQRTINLLEYLDRFFAIKISWQNLFQPLYQERTILGYVFGFIFRFLMVVVALIFYSLIIILAASIYLIWALILPYLFLRIFI